MADSLISIIGAFVASIIGALIGGLLAIFAAYQSLRDTHTNNLTLQNRAQYALVRGFLLAVKAELTGLAKLYAEEATDNALNEVADGHGFEYHVPLHQNYFVVFDSNGALLGQISDDDLRTNIIQMYLISKGIVNVHTLNNGLLEERKTLRRNEVQNPEINFDSQIAEARAAVIDYGHTIAATYATAKQQLQLLLPQIDAEVARLNDLLANER